jgi:translation initiation factor 3 subunit D
MDLIAAEFAESEGWGPGAVPSTEIPYAPFSKQDSMGKPVDWFQQQGGATKVSNLLFNAFDNEQAAFSLVDNKPKVRVKNAGGAFGGNKNRKPVFRMPGYRGNPKKDNSSAPVLKGKASSAQFQGGRKKKSKSKFEVKRKWGNRGWDNKLREVLASVQILESWELVKELPFNTFSRELKEVDESKEIEDVLIAGNLKVYDLAYDKLSAKTPVPLKKFDDSVIFNVTTSEDPIIQKLSGEASCKSNVFATDRILALLMASPKSVNSWDIIVRKDGNKIFLDKRALSQIDFLSVYETSNERFPEEIDSINHPINLSKEATEINENFCLQVLKAPESTFSESNPFVVDMDDPSKAAPVAYRYRTIQLSEDINVLCRCELSALSSPLEKGADPKFVALRALNEYERSSSGDNWRQKLDAQKGSILATEYQANKFKMSRWIAESILSGAEMLRIGFVSRKNSEDPSQHLMVGTMKFRPDQWAAQVNVSIRNLFGILKALIEHIQSLDDGTFLMFRVPNESLIRIYRIPPETFKNEVEDLDDGADQ